MGDGMNGSQGSNSGQSQGAVNAGEGFSFGDPTTQWDPSGVQAMLLSACSAAEAALSAHQDPTYILYYITYLMQEYGVQVMGLQSQQQGDINQFFDKVQDAWNMLYSGDNAGSINATGIDTKFETDMWALRQEVEQSGLFSGANSGMAVEMTANLLSIEEFVVSGAPGLNVSAGESRIYAMWVQYDPSLSGGSGQGSPDNMNTLNREMGQVNQQFTGESQAVAAVTQSDAKTYQAEQDNMNNFMRSVVKLLGFFQQGFRTN